jgi:parvulin-like peptidyl-prolyl isomerase
MSKTKKMRLSHILLSWDQALRSTHSRELIYAIDEAKQIIASLQRGGYSWETACKENSACDTYINSGDLGWFEEHEITQELWMAGLVTPIGELNPEPVTSPYGVHIIYRTG